MGNNYSRCVSGVQRGEPIQGTDVNSGAATSGQVLTADGAGGASFQTAGGATYRAGKVAISSGATSVTITFSSAFSNTNYACTVIMINTTDANPQFMETVITAQSASAITVSWNAPVETANYSLMYTAQVNN